MQEPASVGDLVHASAYTSLGELSESGIFSTYIYILMKDQKNIGGKKIGVNDVISLHYHHTV